MTVGRPFRLIRLAVAFSVLPMEGAQGGIAPLQQEVDLRAALVIGFARFTEWPVSREGPLVIGVVGSPGMAAALERVSVGKMVNGRSIVVRQSKQFEAAAGCHILYFGRLSAPRFPEAMTKTHAPVLTIGEEARFLAAGGAVYLFEEDGRMSFEVNLAALQLANVSISSKLLRLGYTSSSSRRGRSSP